MNFRAGSARELAKLTRTRVRDGGCRHGDGNADTAATAVLPAAASPTAATEEETED